MLENYWDIYVNVLKNKYFLFDGRTSRREYWSFFLINMLIIIAISIIDGLFETNGIIGGIYSLALLLPNLGLSVRRLHDLGKSGWLLLLGLIPLIGVILLLIWFVGEGQPNANEYGEVPTE